MSEEEQPIQISRREALTRLAGLGLGLTVLSYELWKMRDELGFNYDTGEQTAEIVDWFKSKYDIAVA